jgi:hypothetical protein
MRLVGYLKEIYYDARYHDYKVLHVLRIPEQGLFGPTFTTSIAGLRVHGPAPRRVHSL